MSTFNTAPISISDYRFACIHLAWYGNTNGNTLLFSMVELLPNEFPSPTDEEYHCRIGGTVGGDIRLVRAAATATDALEWYAGVGGSTVQFPHRLYGKPDPGNRPSKPLTLSDLAEEPEWPTMVTVTSEAEDDLPFLPGNHRCPRIHSKWPKVPLLILDDLGDHYRIQAIEWLSERLYFELSGYPECLGSIHLIAPNPIFRPPDIRELPDNHGVSLKIPSRATPIDPQETGGSAIQHCVARIPKLEVKFPNAHTFEMCVTERMMLLGEDPQLLLLAAFNMWKNSMSFDRVLAVFPGGESGLEAAVAASRNFQQARNPDKVSGYLIELETEIKNRGL